MAVSSTNPFTYKLVTVSGGGSTTSTLQDVTTNGNTTTNAIQFAGGTSTAAFRVQGVLQHLQARLPTPTQQQLTLRLPRLVHSRVVTQRSRTYQALTLLSHQHLMSQEQLSLVFLRLTFLTLAI